MAICSPKNKWVRIKIYLEHPSTAVASLIAHRGRFLPRTSEVRKCNVYHSVREQKGSLSPAKRVAVDSGVRLCAIGYSYRHLLFLPLGRRGIRLCKDRPVLLLLLYIETCMLEVR